MSDCKRCGTRFITEDHAEWCPGPDRNPELPRRIRTDRWTPAEHAIGGAMEAVEAAGADVALTDAVVLLQAARERVADFVDGVEGTRMVPRPYIESPSPVPPSADIRPVEACGKTVFCLRGDGHAGPCSMEQAVASASTKPPVPPSAPSEKPAAAPVNAPVPPGDESFASAKKPDAPEPPHWRVGTQVGRTVYDGPKGSGHLIGVMDTPELARRVVDAVNASPAAAPAPPAWPQGVNDAHAVWHPGWRKDCALCAPAVPSVPVGDLEGTPIDYRIAMRLGKAARALRSLIQGGGR